VRWLSKILFGSYRLLLSPMLHLATGASSGCRFEPSCSQFAEEAILSRGWVAGAALAIRRICRCHPFAKGGFDPVPQHAITPRNSEI
jgi:putative membrane protein insertion efficiency factor